MTTSLASQLKKLAAPQTSLFDEKKKRASILFTHKEAANLGLDTMLKIGNDGFRELLVIDEQVKSCNFLFGKTSRDFQRAVRTKQENAEIDKVIEKFLLLVSPHLQLQATLKSLEWLVYRFMINEMNVDALMMCILPYYESALFVRILQIVNIDSETSRWHWLKGAQKLGTPVPRKTILTHWGSSQPFRKFLVGFLEKMLALHGKKSNRKVAVSFFVTTVAGSLQQIGKIQEDHITYLVSSLHGCLISNDKELVCGMYYILVQLTVRTKLSNEFFNIIIGEMMKSPGTEVREQLALTIIAICQFQEECLFSPDTLSIFKSENMKWFWNTCTEVSRTRSILVFFTLYIKSYVGWVVGKDFSATKGGLPEALCSLILELEQLHLSPADATKLIRCLFEALADCEASLKRAAQWKTVAGAVLHLERSHPLGYDKAVQDVMTCEVIKGSRSAALKQKRVLRRLLKGQDAEGGVFMMLNHAEENTRLEAAKIFIQKLQNKQITDKILIKEGIENMLTDESPAIIKRALSLDDHLLDLDCSLLLKLSVGLLEKSRNNWKKAWIKVRERCLILISRKLCSKYNRKMLNTALQVCVVSALFPHGPTGATEAKIVLQSKLGQQDKLLSSINSAVSPVLIANKNPNSNELLASIWKVLPKVMDSLPTWYKDSLWCRMQKTKEEEEMSLLGHFLVMLLMQQSLGGAENEQKLGIAHQLVDFTLTSLREQKVSSVKTSYKGKKSDEETEEKRNSGKKKDKFILNIEEVEESVIAQWLSHVQQGILPLQFVLMCLMQSVKVVSLTKEMKTNHFWSLKEDKKDEILLLVKCLKSAVLLEHFGQDGSQARDVLSIKILKDCLGSPQLQMRLLSVVWATPVGVPGSSTIVDDALQVWTLLLGSALVRMKVLTSSWILSTKEMLIPTLLVTLISPNKHVRKAATKCLQSIYTVAGSKLGKNSYDNLVERLLSQAEELIADNSHIPVLIRGMVDMPNPLECPTIEVFVNHLCQPQAPMAIKSTLLYTLCYIKSEEMLKKLVPLAQELLNLVSTLPANEKLDMSTSYVLYRVLLHFVPEAAAALDEKEAWNVFLKAVNCPKLVMQIDEKLVSPQCVIMEQVVSPQFIKSVRKTENQAEFWGIVIGRIAESEDPTEASQLQKGLRKVNLRAPLVLKELEKLELVAKVSSMKESRAKRIKQRESAKEKATDLAWKKLSLMLETIGVMASLEEPWLLVSPLCQHLKQALASSSSATDVVHQQILSALQHLVQSSMEQLGKGAAQRLPLNVELIVQCIRSSSNPDTHRRALLILTQASQLFPDVVMHNVMAIFTFMGASLFHRDDSYSFQVIYQTFEAVIPTIINSKNHSEEEMTAKLADIVQIFVDALPDLPEHRKLPLFSHLTRTIGQDKHFWIFLALLAESHITKGSVPSEEIVKVGEEKRRIPKDIEFILVLCAQLSVKDELRACSQLVEYLNNLPEDKEEDHRKDQQVMRVMKSPIKWENHSAKQFMQYKYTCAGLLSHLLSSDSFVAQVFEMEDTTELHSLYEELLKKILIYVRQVTASCNKHREAPSGRFWFALQRKLLDVLDRVNALLPPGTFIRVILGLLNSSIALIRCRATEMLAAKLQPSSSFFNEDHIENLVPFMKKLINISTSNKENLENQQAALYSLQLLIKLLSHHKVSPATFTFVLQTAVTILCNEDTSSKLTTQALLVIAECVASVKAHSVPHLPKLIPALISHMSNSNDADYIVLASATALHKAVENIPQFLSPYLGSMIEVLCTVSSQKEITTEAGTKESRLMIRLHSIKDILAQNVEPRVLIPRLVEAYHKLQKSQPSALLSHMSLVESFVGHVSPDVLRLHKDLLIDLFKEALILRTKESESEFMIRVEGGVISALVRLLLRLNEDDNIAIFLSIQHWAFESVKDQPERLITFFRFADSLAGALKILFLKAKLADHLYSRMAKLLNENNTLNSSNMVFGSRSSADKKTCILLNYIIDTLTKIFLYDSVNFTNQERFEIMLLPLLDQLENNIGDESAYKKRLSDHLIPCVVKFTIAVGDDSLWKDINRQILLRVRNDDDPKVILAALDMFEALVDQLGEDYLQPLLADTIPYVTEVLESLNTEVEVKTKNIFVKMENILGDSLKTYLD
ncbi:HEAT repeat containing 1 homolog l(2)k09022 [Oratosquilla oratoria]|uniref:HEAT repeat containing 1 homolog l(2)k09022 n=1 Tax=Oratosquilla oratoria TaxID=337810 RepID=UPI003F775CEC